MNSNLQVDLHPDADSLNAFAEQALGKAEREQILAHMTRCSRCRQVIYLAQKAAEAEALEAPAPMTPKRWYKGWRFTWVPATALAAALAAALALVVTIYPRHTAPAPEMAKAVSQSVPPAPVPQIQASAGAAHGPALAAAANSVAENKKFAALRQPRDEFALEAAPSAARSTGENSFAPSLSVQPAQMQAQQQFPSQFNSEPAVGGFQQQQRMAGALSPSANATRATQETMSAAMERAPAGQSRPAFAAVSHTAKQNAPAASFAIGRQEAMAGLAASRNQNLPALPSGLAAISTAAAHQRMLAIDLAGALFLSEDAGKHWEPVAQQWTGRAVKVRVEAGADGAIFQMTNLSGFSWTSTDGKTWTVQ
ncbi:MAG: hypothetical protein ABSD72_14640 [Terracidiphilus sp.]